MYDNKKESEVRKFATQRLTEKQKIKLFGSVKEWCAAVVKQIETNSFLNGQSRINRSEIADNIELSKGKFDQARYDLLTNPYRELAGPTQGKEYKFPVEMVNYDIINSKLGVLEGEEALRKSKYHVSDVTEDATNEIVEAKKQMLDDFLRMKMMTMLSPQGQQAATELELGPKNPVPEGIKTPADIEKYFKFSYRNTREETGNKILEYLSNRYNLDWIFNIGMKQQLITASELYKIDSNGVDPIVRNISIQDIDFDLPLYGKYLDEAAWVLEVETITIPDFIARYGGQMDDDDWTQLERFENNDLYGSTLNMGGNPYSPSNSIYDRRDRLRVNSTQVKAIHCEWKSLVKVGYATIIDPLSGESHEELVDEYFKPNKLIGESVEWTWIPQVWQCTKIGYEGNDIIVNARPRPNQRLSENNPALCRLSYTGHVGEYSLMTKLKPLQITYNIVMFRLMLALAREKGKIALVDINLMPKSEGFTIEKWMHFGDTMGIMFINSAEGRADGNEVRQNFQSNLDLTLGNQISVYLQILNQIEANVSKMAGIPPQREGQTYASETLGGNNQALAQSSAVTYPIFMVHEYMKARVLEMLLNEARFVYKDGRTLAWLSDGERNYLQVDSDFVDAEFGIFMTNAAKENEIFTILKQQGMQLAQSGNMALSDLIKVFKTSSLTEAVHILEDAQEKLQQIQSQQAQSQAQSQQQIEMAKVQAQLELLKPELEFKREELAAKVAMNTENNDARITAAEFQAVGRNTAAEMQRGLDMLDQDHNHVMDIMEHKKEVLQGSVEHMQNQQELDQNQQEIDQSQQQMEQDKQLAIKDQALKAKEIAAKKAKPTPKY